MFYTQLVKLCKERGVKPSPVLKELGLSSGNLKRWANGASANYDTLDKLAKYFGISVNYFFDDDNQKKKIAEVLNVTTAELVVPELICQLEKLGFKLAMFDDEPIIRANSENTQLRGIMLEYMDKK